MVKAAKQGQKNPKPKQQPQKRGDQRLKRRINLWSLGRKGNADRLGNENTRQMSHLWNGYSGQMGGLLEPLPRHHSAGAYLGTCCGASKPLLQQTCAVCVHQQPSLNRRHLRMGSLLVSDNHAFTGMTQWLLQPSLNHTSGELAFTSTVILNL